MKKWLAVTVLCVLLSSIPVAAQEDVQAVNVKRSLRPGERFSAILLAQQTAAYGYSRQAPNSLILAADMLLDHPVAQPEAGDMPDRLSPEHLLQDAKALAEGNEALMQLAAQVEHRLNERPRGLIEGHKTLVPEVAARSQYQFRGMFEAGQLAEVLLINTGDTELELYVYDEGGHLIDVVKASDRNGYLAWVPRWTGEFIIIVKNPGTMLNQCILLVGFEKNLA